MSEFLSRLRGKPKASATPEATNPSASPWPGSFSDWTWTAVLFLFLTTTLVQGFEIPTGSMEGTLLIGDRLLVNKQAYAASDALSRAILPYREPQRGDIIVFRYPLDINQAYVKRVVGLPGDRLHLKNRQLFLNGQPVDEPYLSKRLMGSDYYRDNFPLHPEASGSPLPRRAMQMHELYVRNGELHIPDGFYFAMGDNRDNSLDSRYWGLVPRENIMGKPLLIYWSFGAEYTDDFPTGMPSRSIRFGRMLRVISSFPTGPATASNSEVRP
jgi:signal peptidase I